MLTIKQNVTNMAISQYNNFFFDRGMVKIGGDTYALSCTSLNKLTGGTDNGTVIPAKCQTGTVSFAEGRQRVRSIHVGGQFGDDSAVNVKYAMDSFTPDFSCIKASTANLGNNGSGRIKFNGVRTKHGEHLSVEVSNTAGKSIFVTGVSAFVITGTRK